MSILAEYFLANFYGETFLALLHLKYEIKFHLK